MPWVLINIKNITVTGLKAHGTNFGKPGLVNIIMGGLAAACFLIPRIWAKRTNLFICAFNIAWAVRNYIVVSACYAGECPEKQVGLYLLLIASGLLLLAALLPDLHVPSANQDSSGFAQ